jgi:hypothetical protein
VHGQDPNVLGDLQALPSPLAVEPESGDVSLELLACLDRIHALGDLAQ